MKRRNNIMFMIIIYCIGLVLCGYALGVLVTIWREEVDVKNGINFITMDSNDEIESIDLLSIPKFMKK